MVLDNSCFLRRFRRRMLPRSPSGTAVASPFLGFFVVFFTEGVFCCLINWVWLLKFLNLIIYFNWCVKIIFMSFS